MKRKKAGSAAFSAVGAMRRIVICASAAALGLGLIGQLQEQTGLAGELVEFLVQQEAQLFVVMVRIREPGPRGWLFRLAPPLACGCSSNCCRYGWARTGQRKASWSSHSEVPRDKRKKRAGLLEPIEAQQPVQKHQRCREAANIWEAEKWASANPPGEIYRRR